MSLFDNFIDWFKGKKETTEPVETVDTTGSNTSDWQNFLKNVNLSTANSKAELSAINSRTNSYVDNYLKSLGLQGTSAGATQLALNGTGLQNAYTQLNQNANDYIDAQRQQNTDYLANEYQSAVNNGASSTELQSILDKYDDDSITSGYKKYLNSQAVQEIDWSNDKEETIYKLNNMLNTGDLSDYQKAQVNNLLGKLNDVKTSAQYNKLVNQYNELINDASSTAVNVSDDEALQKVANGEYSEVISVNDVPNDATVSDGGNVNVRGEDFKSFNMKNGYQYIINSSKYVYKNGKLYKLA